MLDPLDGTARRDRGAERRGAGVRPRLGQAHGGGQRAGRPGLRDAGAAHRHADEPSQRRGLGAARAGRARPRRAQGGTGHPARPRALRHRRARTRSGRGFRRRCRRAAQFPERPLGPRAETGAGGGRFGAHTDSESVFLPAVVADFDSARDNFALAKVMVTMLWAQTRFGTFRCDIAAACSRHPDPARALRCFHALDTLRLEAAIAHQLPGIGREMRRLRQLARADDLPPAWREWHERLARPGAEARDALACLDEAYGAPLPPARPYQGELHPERVAAVMAARIEREKDAAAGQACRDAGRCAARAPPRSRGSRASSSTPGPGRPATRRAGSFSWTATRCRCRTASSQLLTSIQLDLGEIPPEYLVPARAG